MVTPAASMYEPAGSTLMRGDHDDDCVLALHVRDSILDRRATTALAPGASPVREIKPKILIQSKSVENQEAVPTIGSFYTTPRTDEARSKNLDDEIKSSCASLDKHRPLGDCFRKRELMPRRGHSKSRRGCYNCKRRRVKCPENHPVCTQCTRRGLICKWPELYIGQEVENSEEMGLIPPQMELSAPTFTAQDFRLFQHFIHYAHPAKPLGNESVWTHEIPSISHNYDYLLHAILALSASDLDAVSGQTSSDLVQAATFHRIRAIKSFNRALSEGLKSPENGNAILATCYILLFQSALIGEGFSEYLTFVRGCVLVPLHMDTRGLKFMFQNILSDEEIELSRPYLQGLPALDLNILDAASASLAVLRPFCERDMEKTMCDGMLEIVRNYYISACDGYLAWMKGSIIFSCSVNHEEFLILLNPSNLVGKIILSHLAAIQTLMPLPIEDERSARKAALYIKGMIKWLEVLYADIEPQSRKYVEWPIKRAAELREWVQYGSALAKG